jgi:hypothetical protein
VIEITRALARNFRAVLRKVTPLYAGRGPRPAVVLHAGPDGLRLRSGYAQAALEYRLAGPRPEEALVVPAEALDDCASSKDTPVLIEKVSADGVQIRWDDGGVPQVRTFSLVELDKALPAPAEPKEFTTQKAGFLKVLDDAAKTASREVARYALVNVQLRGGKGELIATDGKQVLIQGGFSFPWKEDLLVPAVGVFACKEVPQDAPVGVGWSAGHVCVRVGPWSFHLAIDPAGRFPDVEQVLPAASATVTSFRLSAEDAAFLGRVLPRLPGGDDDQAPLTVDVGNQVVVRARAEGQERVTEVVLTGSEVQGPPLRLVCNRGLLARALQLGFTEFALAGAEVPVVCRQPQRTFAWMPLGKDAALPPAADAVRIASQEDKQLAPQPSGERRTAIMTTPQSNGQSKARDNGHAVPYTPAGTPNGHGSAPANGSGFAALIAEAQALREALRQACTRAGHLVTALKRQRRQQRLAASALASLKQLQQIDG